ncbi:MAG TPA: hypothetical protein VN452_00720 [Longilinea sp.]|nr:hypothetical protein [Longilinea sp.]
MSKGQKRWLWSFTVFTILLTAIPYLIGFANEGVDWVFTGFVFGVEDGNSYIAKMLLGTTGDWLFRTPYTTLPQNGFLAFLPYILLGKLAGGKEIHLQLVMLFQLFRAAGIICFVFASYGFTKVFILDERRQRWAVVLATFGGGLGWLVIFGLKTGGFEQLPLEFYSPESFGFLGVFGLPHLAIARALLLWGLAGFLTKPPGNPFLYGMKIGVFWLLLGFMQPLTIVTGWAVVGSVIILSWIFILIWKPDLRTKQEDLRSWQNHLKTAFGMILVSSPMVIYNFFSFTFVPVLRGWSQQNIILSPPPGDYLLAYGVMIPFALVGIVRAVRTKDWIWAIPIAWVVIFPILAYLPYTLQRRLPEGVWLAWIVLALFGVEGFAHRWKLLSAALIGSGIISTFVFFAGSIWAVSTPAEPLYKPMEKINGYIYLADNVSPGSNILSSYSVGNSLPAWAPVHVVIGHGPESVNLSDLKPQVEGFFSTNELDRDRIAFIKNERVGYLFYGPDEHLLGEWNPENAAFLKEIYSRDGYTIYQVKLAE